MLLKEKENIEMWLNKYGVKNYTLIKDEKYGYVVNTSSHVILSEKKLYNLNVKFNEVNGDFICSHNLLDTLEGSPEIVNGNFNCSNNQLKNLLFSPQQTFNGFLCNNNKLETLEGISKFVGFVLHCSNNNLTLEGLKYLNDNISIIFISLKRNEKLGYLQEIDNIEEIKEVLKIQKEKEILNLIKPKTIQQKKIYKI